MTSYDVYPEPINSIVANAASAAEDLVTAVSGSSTGSGSVSGPTGGVSGVSLDFLTAFQSGLAEKAMSGYFENSTADFQFLGSKTASTLTGTVNATKAITSGDEQMAAGIQSAMNSATDSGSDSGTPVGPRVGAGGSVSDDSDK